MQTTHEELVFSERFDVATQTWIVERVVMQPDGRYALKPWTVVQRSCIQGAGDGVYAARHFPKGATIGFYCGEIAMENQKPDDACYLLELDDIKHSESVVIDAAYGGNWTRKINDGSTKCNPHWRKSRCNVEFADHNKIIAIKPIRVGEEMLIDYGDQYWTY